MIKQLLAISAVLCLIGCSKPLSLSETEQLLDKCKTQGGTPIAHVWVSKVKDDAQVYSVSCEKDGLRFSEF